MNSSKIKKKSSSRRIEADNHVSQHKDHHPVNGRLAYKIDEAARLIGVHSNSIRRLIKSGQLKVCGKLRHILIPHQELMNFLTPREIA